jgi:hypothetical protein
LTRGGFGINLKLVTTGDVKAHEHHRAWSGLCPISARVGGAHRLGLATVSLLWAERNLQEWQLCASPVDIHGAAGCAGAASPVLALSAQLLGTVAPDLVGGGWGELVRAGSAPYGRGPLAAWGQFAAPDGRVGAFLAGAKERWGLWRPLEERVADRERCSLGASTVHRWLGRAGQVAQEGVPGQLRGIASSGQMGTDGLWARLRRGGPEGGSGADGQCQWAALAAGG